MTRILLKQEWNPLHTLFFSFTVTASLLFFEFEFFFRCFRLLKLSIGFSWPPKVLKFHENQKYKIGAPETYYLGRQFFGSDKYITRTKKKFFFTS